MKIKLPMPCFICEREFKPAFLNVEVNSNQPSEGVTFHTYGQYGSTVFDPMDKSRIEINICDPCLLKYRSRVVWTQYGDVYEQWNPENDD